MLFDLLRTAQSLPQSPAGETGARLSTVLFTHSVTAFARQCPSAAPLAPFLLAKEGPLPTPRDQAFSRTAAAMGTAADPLARAFDREYFARRFIRLSTAGRSVSPATFHGEETVAGNLSTVFAAPALKAGRADPRGKIYSTQGLSPQSLAARVVDPASGLEASRSQTLLMDEARAGSRALVRVMASRASTPVKGNALFVAAFLAARAYRAGYPSSYPLVFPLEG